MLDSITYSILTNDDIYSLSCGEVTNSEEPVIEPNKKRILFKEGSLYCEKIFGPSKDGMMGFNLNQSIEEYDERNKRFGHIYTGVHVTHPLSYISIKNNLPKIIGFQHAKDFTNINTCKAFLLDTRNLESKDSGTYMEFMFERNTDDKLESKVSVLDLKVITGELARPGRLFIVNKDILNQSVSQYPAFDSVLKDPETVLLSGGVAITYLMSRIDIRNEYKELDRLVNEYLLTYTTNDMTHNYLELFGPTTKRETINKLNYRRNVLAEFINQGRELKDFVLEAIPVLPAGLRDKSLIRGGSSSDIKLQISSELNTPYKNIIDNKNLLKPLIPEYSIDYIFDNPNDVTWAKNLKAQILASNWLVTEYMSKLVANVEQIFNNRIPEILGKKHGYQRATLLSKTINNSGRAVITPDPTLHLDEIGVPYSILYAWFKKDLEASVREKLDNLNISVRPNEIRDITNIKQNIWSISKNDYDSSELVNITTINEDRATIIKEVIKETLSKILEKRRTLSIRYPSLHKYNELCFKPTISWDDTIHVPPLICAGYNADFDGDTKALFLLEHAKSIEEIDRKLLPSKNMVSSSGEPMNTPTQEIILGLYATTSLRDLDKYLDRGISEKWRTGQLTPKEKKDACINNPKVKIFNSMDELEMALNRGEVDYTQLVGLLVPGYFNSEYKYQLLEDSSNIVDYDIEKVEINNINSNTKISADIYNDSYINTEYKRELVFSTVGRFLFNTIVPQDLGFVDRTKDKFSLEIDDIIYKFKNRKSIGVDSPIIKEIISIVQKSKSSEETLYVLDRIKDMGYEMATLTGISMSVQDIVEDPIKRVAIEEAQRKIALKEAEARSDSNISQSQLEEEKMNIWRETTDLVNTTTLDNLGDDNPVKMMMVSGSRGSKTQLSQLMGMRGLINDASGHTLPNPIKSGFGDGMSTFDISVGAAGSRKGIYDRSNKTKDTGELTRICIYGTSGISITTGDCGDFEGKLEKEIYYIQDPMNLGKVVSSEKVSDNKLIELQEIVAEKKLSEIVKGRLPIEDIEDENGKLVIRKNKPMDKKTLEWIDEHLGKSYVVNEYEIDENGDKTLIKTSIKESRGLHIRTPETCKAPKGCCSRCYGVFTPEDRYSRIGDPVGMSASQSICERATQLTMRTFHTGGVRAGDVTKTFDYFIKLVKTKNPDLSKIIEDAVKDRDNKIKDFLRSEDEIIEFQKNVYRNYKEAVTKYSEEYGVPINKLKEEISSKDFRGIMKYVSTEYNGCFNKEIMDAMTKAIHREFEEVYLRAGIHIDTINYKVFTAAMTNYEVIHSGMYVRTLGDVVRKIELFSNNINTVLNSESYKDVFLVAPTYISMIKSGRDVDNEITKAMYFRNIKENISSIGLKDREDKLTDPIISVTFSNDLTVGSGYTEKLRDTYLSISKSLDRNKIDNEVGIVETEYKPLEETLPTDTKPQPVEEPKDMENIELEWDKDSQSIASILSDEAEIVETPIEEEKEQDSIEEIDLTW